MTDVAPDVQVCAPPGTRTPNPLTPGQERRSFLDGSQMWLVTCGFVLRDLPVQPVGAQWFSFKGGGKGRGADSWVGRMPAVRGPIRGAERADQGYVLEPVTVEQTAAAGGWSPD